MARAFRAYDPVAIPEARMQLNGTVHYCETAYAAAPRRTPPPPPPPPRPPPPPAARPPPPPPPPARPRAPPEGMARW